MTPIRLNAGSPWPSLDAAAQAEWWVNASTGSDSNTGEAGSPLARADEIDRRCRHLPTSVAVVYYIEAPLTDGDVVTARANGPGGSLTVYGLAQAPFTTSTLTSASAAALNVPAIVGNAASDWATFLTSRRRITNGANVGAVFWPARSIASVDAEYASAIIDDPSGYSLVAPTAGDEYVTEPLVSVTAIRFPYATTGEGPIGTTVARTIFRGLNVSLSSLTTAPSYGGPNEVAFYGCSLSNLTGTFTAIACAFAADTVLDDGATIIRGCVFRGSPVIGRNADSDWGGDTLVSGGAGMVVKGHLLVSGDVRCCNSSAVGFVVYVGGTVICSPNAAIRGAANGTIGLFIMAGARMYYDLASGGLPKVVGNTGELKLSGKPLTYNSILYGQPTDFNIDGAVIARYGTGTYASPLTTPFTADVTVMSVAVGAEVVACIATLPINGPSFTIPANAGGAGFVIKFLQPWTASGTGIDVIVEGWLGTSLYYSICGDTITTSAVEGEHRSIGASSPYTYPAGIGLDLRVRIINNGTSIMPPVCVLIWS